VADTGGYPNLPEQISEAGARLQARAEGAVAADVQRFLALVDEFHRTGLSRLVAMIQQWRGEIFLESAEEDPVVGTLLRTYDLPSTELG